MSQSSMNLPNGRSQEWNEESLDEAEITALVTQRTAPAIALRHLEMLHAEWEYILRDFLGALPGPYEDGGPLTQLNVIFAANGSSLGIRAAAPPAEMIAASADFFEKVGADPDALEYLASYGEANQPAELGMWLDLRVGSANCGWYIPEGDMPLAEGIMLDSDHFAAVSNWGDATRVGHFMAAGRTVAEGSALAFIEAPVPGDEVEQVANVLNLLNTFNALQPEDAVLAAFMNERHDGLEASLWLLESGVARSGIRAEDPSLGLIIALAEAIGDQDLDLVAQLQGILQSDEASAVEVQLRGGETHLLVTCSLA